MTGLSVDVNDTNYQSTVKFLQSAINEYVVSNDEELTLSVNQKLQQIVVVHCYEDTGCGKVHLHRAAEFTAYLSAKLCDASFES